MNKKNMTNIGIILFLLVIQLTIADLITPPVILSSSPNTIQNSLSLNLSVTTDENSYCKYDGIDKDYADMLNDFSTQNTTNHQVNIVLSFDGNYSFYVRCKDEYNNEMTSSELIRFEIDSNTPSITEKSPQGVISGDRVILNITTNEDTTCKYDQTNTNYDQMTGYFDTNTRTIHEEEILHLGEGQKFYYIACQDKAKNTAINTLSFYVGLPVSATISLSKTPPLTQGTYEVTLTTTKNLPAAPTLYYKFDDDNSPRTVSLVGQDQTWKGYIVIAESNLDRVAKFYFSGTDYNSITGNKITSGELFLIDTKKPDKVTSIASYQESDDALIEWFYDGESPEQFNIYRSTQSGVDYTDYYYNVERQKYTDTDVEEGVTYYYRVAVVDKAGNIGELSEETHIGLEEDTNITTEIKTKGLSQSLQIEVNQTVKRLKSDLLDIQGAITNLEKITDPDQLLAVKSLNLVERANNAETSVEETIKQLEALNNEDLTEGQVNEKITSAITASQNAKSDVAKKVVIKDRLNFKQTLNEEDIDQAIKELLLRNEVDEATLQEYKKNATKLLDKTEVYINVFNTEITYYGDEKTTNGVVSKKIVLSQTEKDVNIVEIVPKTVAKRADELSYSTPPRILNDDPVLSWEYSELKETEIYYLAKEEKSLSDLKITKTVILPSPKGYLAKEEPVDSPTGNVINTSAINGIWTTIKGSLAIIVGVIIIAGLSVYYFFFLKMDNSEQIFHQTPQNYQQQIVMPDNNVKTNGHINILPSFEAKQENFQTDDLIEYRHISNLIDHANTHVDKLDFESAKKEYELLHNLITNTSFSSTAAKNKMIQEVTALYNKIIISSKLSHTREAAKKNEIENLRKHLDEVKTIFELIKSDNGNITPLINYTSDYIKYYDSILNNLKRKYKG